VQTLVERVFHHERAVLLAIVAAVTLACWSWIVPMARDMYGTMAGPSAWMMTADWDARHLFLLAAMWIVMMAGMMLPSAAPTLLLYAGALRHRAGADGARTAVYAMAAGYVLVWTAFSLGATALQRLLSGLLVLSPMMEASSPRVSGTLLIAAGIYQLTPLKRACLSSCSAPVAFLMRRWRDGVSGAFRMGLEHGALCVGCCWALMLLLFAGGVMNLTVIAALTAFVLIEKLTPLGPRSVRVTGTALVAYGLWILARS
jgi:predicted metal-binding membrane protein